MDYKNKEYLKEEYYIKGRDAKDIANEFGVSSTTIRVNIKKFGLQRRKHDSVNINYGKDICKDYTENKMTLTDLAIKYLGDQKKSCTIKQVLIDNGVLLRDKSEVKKIRDEKFRNQLNGRIYDLNFDYFKNWTSDMAYVLGFIASDGNVYNNRLKISVKKTDIDILEKMKKSLGYSGDIFNESNKCNGKTFEISTLSIHSKEICNDLKALNITENKSLTLNMDNIIPKEFKLDFVRGYFDGDGSIGMMYPTNSKGTKSNIAQIRFRICSGSFKILELIVEAFKENGIKETKIRKCKNKELYEIEYSTNSALEIYELLYKDKNSISLDRKRNRFEEIISIRESEIKNKN